MNYSGNAHLSLGASLFLGAISWFTPENIDLTLKVITAVGALVSAIFAIRYYYYAAQEKKESLKRMKD